MMDIDISALRRDFIVHGSAAPIYRLDRAPLPPAALPCVIAIGAFDGVHRGHLDLLGHAVRDARARGIAALAVTFEPDPDCVVTDRPAPKLTSSRDRCAALATSGVDGVLVVPFDESMAALDHVGFFERVLAPVLDIKSLHVGSDFRLGAGGVSTVGDIAAWGIGRGIVVHGHPLLCDGDEPITSTRIRHLVSEGDLDAVERELGRRYFVRGTVAPGRGEGSKMGFPTANIRLPRYIQRPCAGVYAGFALDGTAAWPAAINVGIPPTFADKEGAAELEANFLGFTGDLYDEDISLLFCRQLRTQRRFDDMDELVATIMGNIDEVRSLYGEQKVELGFDF